MGVVFEYLLTLTFDAGKQHLKDHLDKKKIEDRLRSFIESSVDYNEMCTLAEEIDFQGLIDYIDKNLLEDVEKQLFGVQKERGKARQRIVSQAISYSKADTTQSKQRVEKMVFRLIDMIRDFYRSAISKQDLLLAEEIENEVLQGVQVSEKRISQEIIRSKDEIVNAINEVNGYMPENFMNLAKAGKFQEIQDRMSLQIDAASKGHLLYPYYGVTMEQNILKSIALSPEAKKLYPPHYLCRGMFQLDGRQVSGIDPGIFDYADRHQLTITLEIAEAKKLLGDKTDPFQIEAEKMVGKKLIRYPQPFPPAFPCSISIDGELFYDYIELRTKEIMDDGTYVITNEEQKHCKIRIMIRSRLENVNHKFSFTVETETTEIMENKDLLLFNRFMKGVSERGCIVIHILDWDRDFIRGNLDDFEYDTGFQSLDEEIDFLSRVCEIEDYFGKKITIDENISEYNYAAVKYVSELIRGKEQKFKWTEMSFERSVDQHFRKALSQITEKSHERAFVGETAVMIFGVKLKFKLLRKYLGVCIKNLDRLRQTVEVLEDGDKIIITFISDDNAILIDKLASAELVTDR